MLNPETAWTLLVAGAAVVGRGLKTHPDLYDRLLAAGVEPGFSRPAPPLRRLCLRVALLLLTLILVGAFLLAATRI